MSPGPFFVLFLKILSQGPRMEEEVPLESREEVPLGFTQLRKS